MGISPMITSMKSTQGRVPFKYSVVSFMLNNYGIGGVIWGKNRHRGSNGIFVHT